MGAHRNDSSICHDHMLFRRIPSIDDKSFVAVDEGTGERRLTSACFELKKEKDETGKKVFEDGVSVYLSKVLGDIGLDANALVRAPLNMVVELPASAPRSIDLGVVRDPWPEVTVDPSHPRNKAHALITGMESLSNRKRKEAARELVKCVRVVVCPPGVRSFS